MAPTVSAVTTYRAIATDLDGTLLGSDGVVSARTRTAVLAAEDAGMTVVIATGRPPRWIAPIVDQLGDRGLVVCANGAAVYDPSRHELVRRTELSPEMLAAVVDDLADAFPDAIVGLEQGFDFAIDEAIKETPLLLRGSWNLEGLHVGPIRSFLDEPALKLIVRLPPPAQPGTADAVQSVHRGARAGHPLGRRVVPRGVAPVGAQGRRGRGAPGRLGDRRRRGVVAFGDMPNDLELIRWAGLGVAVANAHPLLQEAADEVTASNDDDGVAMVIERLLGEQD